MSLQQDVYQIKNHAFVIIICCNTDTVIFGVDALPVPSKHFLDFLKSY